MKGDAATKDARAGPPPFHLAFPVHDLAAADAFYGDALGCRRGRRSEAWIDYDFFGHQIVAHLSPEIARADATRTSATSAVDGDAVPVRHFGVVLSPDEWRDLAARLEAASADFIIPPRTRFAGEPGEQGTFFVRDPSGNALEFKCFADMGRLFAAD
ncbi:MAG: VOC family protein [Parvularculaceae bacterium]